MLVHVVSPLSLSTAQVSFLLCCGNKGKSSAKIIIKKEVKILLFGLIWFTVLMCLLAGNSIFKNFIRQSMDVCSPVIWFKDMSWQNTGYATESTRLAKSIRVNFFNLWLLKFRAWTPVARCLCPSCSLYKRCCTERWHHRFRSSLWHLSYMFIPDLSLFPSPLTLLTFQDHVFIKNRLHPHP